MGRPSSRPAGRPSPSWVKHEPVTVAPGLLDHEQREPPVGSGAVGVGPGQQHQHVGPGGEGAPGLHPVDQPATLDRRGRRHDAGDVGAVVGLGDGHRGQQLGAGQPGEPALLLLLGPAEDQGPRQDLGPGDERAADAEGAPGELFGGHDHPEVVALAAGGVAAVRLRHREAEPAELGQLGDDLLGDVAVGPVDVFGVAAGPVPRRTGGTSPGRARNPRRGAGDPADRRARPGTPGRGRRSRRPGPGPSNRRRRPRPLRDRPPGRPGRRGRRRRRRRPARPRPHPGRRSRAWPGRSPPPRRRGPGRRPPPGGRRPRRARAWPRRQPRLPRPGPRRRPPPPCRGRVRAVSSSEGPSGEGRRAGASSRTYPAARRPTTVTRGGRTTGSSPGSTPVRPAR